MTVMAELPLGLVILGSTYIGITIAVTVIVSVLTSPIPIIWRRKPAYFDDWNSALKAPWVFWWIGGLWYRLTGGCRPVCSHRKKGGCGSENTMLRMHSAQPAVCLQQGFMPDNTFLLYMYICACLFLQSSWATMCCQHHSVWLTWPLATARARCVYGWVGGWEGSKLT